MTRTHAMPFGAAVTGDGVRFHLWAPAARSVELCLNNGDREELLPMHRDADGWYRLTTPKAKAGSGYRYRIDGDLRVPDPASRAQATDVHGDSLVIDPEGFAWVNDDWQGRRWSEAVLYELHVGGFSPEGTFEGVRRRLDHLVDLGVTAVELMPVADFPGTRNWGYDGVLPFAPDRAYGTPDDLRRLVDAAHGKGLMIFLDVVYNHFGPDGNYLHIYAPDFFTDRLQTPWGAAIDLSRRQVRDFFIHNALYWLEEYRFDGLRLDAVHAIEDDSEPDFLTELAARVRRHFQDSGRKIHLVLENDSNEAHYLAPTDHARLYDAQWNDDFHHVAHVLLTGETGGYYADYANNPVGDLERSLAEGFVYQGERSPYRNNEPRGEVSGHLPATAFVNFIQNHDQVGNRAFGERLATLVDDDESLRASIAALLLAPPPPLLFMGEEWAARQPFYFFCDFHDELADAVREGRRREFERFPQFADPAARARIPDPNAPETFTESQLDWRAATEPHHAAWLDYYRSLLALRRREVTPHLPGLSAARPRRVGPRALRLHWRRGDGQALVLFTNLGPRAADKVSGGQEGTLLFASRDGAADHLSGNGRLDGWTTLWFLQDEAQAEREAP